MYHAAHVTAKVADQYSGCVWVGEALGFIRAIQSVKLVQYNAGFPKKNLGFIILKIMVLLVHLIPNASRSLQSVNSSVSRQPPP